MAFPRLTQQFYSKFLVSRKVQTEDICMQADYRIIHADCLKKTILSANSCDLIVTSPPYNVGMTYDGTGSGDSIDYGEYLKFTRKWIRNALYWSKDDGRMCINVALDTSKFGKQPLTAQVTQIALRSGWKYFATIVWNEGNISRRTAWGSWKSASAPHIISPVETVIVFYKRNWIRGPYKNDDITKTEFNNWTSKIWSFNGESAKRIGHNAPFPRELPRRCIKLFSKKGETILDPFSGSGTTLIEALLHNRKAIGIEMEERYCQLANRRISENVLEKLL